MLTGSEVKSMRAGKTSIAESYATSRDGELWLLNSNISEYKQAGRFNHEPKAAAQAPAAPAPDQQADRGGGARGHDGRTAENIL